MCYCTDVLLIGMDQDNHIIYKSHQGIVDREGIQRALGDHSKLMIQWENLETMWACLTHEIEQVCNRGMPQENKMIVEKQGLHLEVSKLMIPRTCSSVHKKKIIWGKADIPKWKTLIILKPEIIYHILAQVTILFTHSHSIMTAEPHRIKTPPPNT